MSASSELRELVELARELKTLLGELERAEVPRTQEQFAKLEQVALRYLALANRLGLPDDLNAAINVAQRAAVNVAQLQRALELLAIAQAAAGPLGWLAFGAAAGITALSFADTIETARRTR